MSDVPPGAVTLIAAVARNGVIGNSAARIAAGAPAIPWRLPGELAEFRSITMGGVLVMGRATYDTIGRPLPGRTTIVVTRDPSWSAEGVLVAGSLESALAVAAEVGGEVFVAGGAQIYALAMPLATRQILTLVPADVDGDVAYPEFAAWEWRETRRVRRDGYERVWLRRLPSSRLRRFAFERYLPRKPGPAARVIAGLAFVSGLVAVSYWLFDLARQHGRDDLTAGPRPVILILASIAYWPAACLFWWLLYPRSGRSMPWSSIDERGGVGHG
ncbi:MAG: dihydrofolate reductase [Nocardioides sp.]|uniref:dihydrofolate reductase n=1 Tax=Nocardioides sp. TaxID=35761 RepID=UPI0039E3CBA2